MESLLLRKITHQDCVPINQAFAVQGWEKPISQYEHYCHLQESGTRDVIIAEVNGEFAGYLTICWESNYSPFREAEIPEIVDFNVLKKFQRRGIGHALMDEAEQRVKQQSSVVGIGFGITQDYGAAQILYIKRGYVPDGRGLSEDGRILQYGDQVTIGDEQAFHLTKLL